MTGGDDRERRYAGLMRAAQDGDRAAYASLLRELAPLVRGMVRQRQAYDSGSQDPEDLVQDVLLSLHLARATYDPDRPFFPWLTAIVRNRRADAARREMRQRRNRDAVEELNETFLPAAANMHEEGYGDAEALKAAVAGLPGGQRQAVELLKLREMTLKEASAVSGTSVAALKVAVHRGIRTLRLRLKKEA